METIVLRNLRDNLFSSLGIALNLTDDNKIQWNYLWALKCTSARTFSCLDLLFFWQSSPTFNIIPKHSRFMSRKYSFLCPHHAYIKVGNTEFIINVVCVYHTHYLYVYKYILIKSRKGPLRPFSLLYCCLTNKDSKTQPRTHNSLASK